MTVGRAQAILPLLLLAALPSGCLYTKAPCFPDLPEEARQQLARIEYTTARVNPEDGPRVQGSKGWKYCASPPCTVVREGKIHVLGRTPGTWISLAYLRVYEPAQGMVPLTHESRRDGQRRRIDDGHGHTDDLVIELDAVARLYGLGKGDLIELTVHGEQEGRLERYDFELRPVSGTVLPDRVDVDVAVGVLPIPEVALDVEQEDRDRPDVGRATFPLAFQLSLGWNTVRRASALAEFADRLDLVLALAVINFQGLPSGLASKTSPAFGPGVRIHRVLNFVWYFDLFGSDPVSFPALAVSVDETLRVASSLLRTDIIYKQPQDQRFRVGLSGGLAGSLQDVARPLFARGQGDAKLFPLGHFSFGRRWGAHWTFPQVDVGVTVIPQQGTDDELVFLQVTAGPRVDWPLWDGALRPFAALEGGAFQGYLLREEATNEARLRSGFTIPAGLAIPVAEDSRLATWLVTLGGTLHLIYDFAGTSTWNRYLSGELGLAVEF